MSSGNNKEATQDWTPLANIGLVNQGFLRTILETQTKLLAYLEERDQDEVIDELYGRVNENIRHAVDQHKEKFPGVYSDGSNDR